MTGRPFHLIIIRPRPPQSPVWAGTQYHKDCKPWRDFHRSKALCLACDGLSRVEPRSTTLGTCFATRGSSCGIHQCGEPDFPFPSGQPVVDDVQRALVFSFRPCSLLYLFSFSLDKIFITQSPATEGLSILRCGTLGPCRSWMSATTWW